MTRVFKIITIISRLILGLTFVISGFVKAVDPIGFEIKISDYFQVFNISFFGQSEMLLAIAVSSFEFVLGCIILFAIKKRFITWISFIYMSCMTLLTLYIFIYNPVSDCGCFGDFFVISNGATFYKNIILLMCSLMLFYDNNYSYHFFGNVTGVWAYHWTIIFIISVSVYALFKLPLFDFRPYHVGMDLKKQLLLDSSAKSKEFKSVFIYEKNGVEKEFSESNLPEDSTWVYKDRIVKEISSGQKKVLSDFIFLNSNKENISDKIVSDTSYNFIYVVPRVEMLKFSLSKNVSTLVDYCKKNGYKLYGVTGSDVSKIEEWKYEHDIDIPFLYSDVRELQTIIRTNSGVLMLKDGVILRKWSGLDIPNFSNIEKPLSTKILKRLIIISEKYKFIMCLIVFLIPILFIFAIHKGFQFHIKWRDRSRYKKKKLQEARMKKILDANNNSEVE